MSTRTIPITIRLPEALHARLRARALETGTPLVRILRAAAEHELEPTALAPDHLHELCIRYGFSSLYLSLLALAVRAELAELSDSRGAR